MKSKDMNGDHRQIFEKINSLEIKVAEIKKDTEYIKKEMSNQVKSCHENVTGFNRRITENESWRYKMVGAIGMTSALVSVGIVIILRVFLGI